MDGDLISRGLNMAEWLLILGFIFIVPHSGLATTVAPVITCHDDFNVTITSGSWELIAVEGYELLNATDPMCVSQSKFGALHFDIQDHCQNGAGTMRIFNNTYTFTIRARQEWLVETSEDRLIEMKCEYHLTGDGQFEQSVTVQQDFTVGPTIEATQSTIIAGARLLLVNDRDDRDGQTDGVWSTLDTAQVGQKVRLVVDTSTTPTHPQYPYIGVIGCYFYDSEAANAMRFNMVSGDGCNNPPSYYNPYEAGGTPLVNGMLLNIQPVDDANENENADPVTDSAGYLTGTEEPGVAYSDVFKVFKFPGTNEVRAKCKIRFCVEKNDADCITPNCAGRRFVGLYDNGGHKTVYSRKRRSVDVLEVEEEPELEQSARRRRSVSEPEEEEEEKGEVGEIGFVIKIVEGGEGTRQISASISEINSKTKGSSESGEMASECRIEYYILIAICVLLGIAILASVIAWTTKKSQQNQDEQNLYASDTRWKH